MDKPELQRPIDIDKKQYADLLARLNAGLSPEESKRSSVRHEYAVPVIALVAEHPAGGEGKYIVLGRNISRGGMSVLHAGDGPQLRMSCLQLKGSGAAYGFFRLSVAVHAVVSALELKESEAAIEQRVQRLKQLCRVRDSGSSTSAAA